MDYLALAIAANAVTAITIYLLTKGNIRYGAYTGFFGQCLWLTYIYVTSAWGFLPGDIFIFGMYLKKICGHRIVECKKKKKVKYLSGVGREVL
jgi:hypothetical protein|tara:strand:- start:264 stop:542 length:279 start_codon:yes stop_codon:yes gene_type:complete